MTSDVAIDRVLLPVGSKGRQAAGWWGMLALILSEGALFAYLIFSYFYLASHAAAPWPETGPMPLRVAGPGTVLLLIGSATMWWAERGIMRGQQGRLIAGLGVTVVIAAVFLAMQWQEWHRQPFTLTSSLFGSLYYTLTGFHMAHVLAGLFMLLAMLLWSALKRFSENRHAAISIGALYWHFVTVVWLLIFSVLYVLPRLG